MRSSAQRAGSTLAIDERCQTRLWCLRASGVSHSKSQMTHLDRFVHCNVANAEPAPVQWPLVPLATRWLAHRYLDAKRLPQMGHSLSVAHALSNDLCPWSPPIAIPRMQCMVRARRLLKRCVHIVQSAVANSHCQGRLFFYASTQHTHNTKHNTQHTQHTTQNTYHNTQHTRHHTQHTTHNTQHTTTQHTTHNDTQHTPHNTHHTTHNTQHTTHNTQQYTIHNTQHTTHNTQHTAHSKQHTHKYI